MKKVSFLLLTCTVLLANCSKPDDSTQADTPTATTQAAGMSEDSLSPGDSPAVAEAATPEPEEASASEESNVASPDDCEKFLSDYEAFADSYFALASKYAKNPTDMSIMQEYGEMATKAQEMQGNQPEACQANSAFLNRYTKIAAKVSKAAAAQAQGSAKMMEQMSKQMGQ